MAKLKKKTVKVKSAADNLTALCSVTLVSVEPEKYIWTRTFYSFMSYTENNNTSEGGGYYYIHRGEKAGEKAVDALQT